MGISVIGLIMDRELVRDLVALNSAFYRDFAQSFSDSRAKYEAGYRCILDFMPAGPLIVLDVGCGNGRFGRFLQEEGVLEQYTGVDYSPLFLSMVGESGQRAVQRDLSLPACLDDLGRFDLIACLATLQHIPGRLNRQRLLEEMASHLAPGGRMVVSNWQFLTNPRQQRKILPWESIGIDPSRVEPNDYLLSWGRGGSGQRYVAYLDNTAMNEAAALAGLRIVNQFRADGREGDLNLYTILAG